MFYNYCTCTAIKLNCVNAIFCVTAPFVRRRLSEDDCRGERVAGVTLLPRPPLPPHSDRNALVITSDPGRHDFVTCSNYRGEMNSCVTLAAEDG